MASPRKTEKFVGSVQTSNATQTVVAQFSLPLNCSAQFEVWVNARVNGTGAQNAAGYWRVARFKTDGSAATLVGTIKTPAADDEDVAAWDVTLTTVALDTLIQVQVTGAAATTINWECWGTVYILTN